VLADDAGSPADVCRQARLHLDLPLPTRFPSLFPVAVVVSLSPVLRLNAEGSAPVARTAALHIGQFISSQLALLRAPSALTQVVGLSRRAMGSRTAHARRRQLICVCPARLCGGLAGGWIEPLPTARRVGLGWV